MKLMPSLASAKLRFGSWLGFNKQLFIAVVASLMLLGLVATTAVAADGDGGKPAQSPECVAFQTSAESAMANHVSIVNRFMNAAQESMNRTVSNSCISTIANLNFDLSGLIPDFGLIGTLLNTIVERFTSMIIGKVCDAVSSVVDKWNDVVAGITSDFNANSVLEGWAAGVNSSLPTDWGGRVPSTPSTGGSVDLVKPTDIRPTPPNCKEDAQGNLTCTGGSGGGGGDYTTTNPPVDSPKCQGHYAAVDRAATAVQRALSNLHDGKGSQADVDAARAAHRAAQKLQGECEAGKIPDIGGGSGSGSGSGGDVSGTQVAAAFARLQMACVENSRREAATYIAQGGTGKAPLSESTLAQCREAVSFYAANSRYIGPSQWGVGVPDDVKRASSTATQSTKSSMSAPIGRGGMPAVAPTSPVEMGQQQGSGFSLPIRQ